MADTQQYSHKTIRGVQVIVWEHIPYDAKTDKAVRKSRKQYKEKVGAEHINTPMLDMRQYNDTLQYCDMVLSTENVHSWDEALKLHFKGRVDKKYIKAGHQLVVLTEQKDSVFITVNVYPGTNRIMVQPGDHDEKNLLEFLAEFPNITALKDTDSTLVDEVSDTTLITLPNGSPAAPVPSAVLNTLNHSKTPTANTPNTSQSSLQNEVPHITPLKVTNGIFMPDSDEIILRPQMSSTPSTPIPRSKPLTVLVKKNDDTQTHAATNMCNKSVMTDCIELGHKSVLTDESLGSVSSANISTVPDQQKGCDQGVMTENVAVSDSHTMTTNIETCDKCVESNIMITNELLCFVQNKLDTVPFDTLVKLCANFYSTDVINQSKTLLYKLCQPDNNVRPKKHIGPERATKDVKDILQWFLQMNIPYKYKFVACDLSNMPPLSMLNCDNAKLLKEIESLKLDFHLLIVTQRDMAQQLASFAQSKCTQSNNATQTVLDYTRSVTFQPKTDPVATVSSNELVASASSQNIKENITPCSNVKPLQVIISDSEKSTDEDTSVHDTESDTEADQSVVTPRYSHEPMQRPHVNLPISNRFDVLASDGNPGDTQASLTDRHKPPSTHRPHTESTRPSRFNATAAEAKPHKVTSKPEPVRTRVFTRSNPQMANLGYRTHSPLPRHSVTNNRPDVVYGQGPSIGLKTVQRQTNAMFQNKVCTGMFVTRLAPKTTTASLEKFLLKETGLVLKSEKLKTRYDTYSSFHIWCDRSVLNNLLNTDIWPRGVLIKPFFQ